MNAKDAISAHMNWKLRIHTLLSGKSTEKFDPATIAKDNVCELGKWIHSEGKSQMPPPQYAELMATHAEFHREAARIVRESCAGRKMGMEAIEMDSPFGKPLATALGAIRTAKRLAVASYLHHER